MEYTKDLDRRIRVILQAFVREYDEIQARPEQPEFNKALDRACAYNEAVEKIIKETAAPDMYEALCSAVAILRVQGFQDTQPVLEPMIRTLAKAEGK